MQNKSYKVLKDNLITVEESAIAYQTNFTKTPESLDLSSNIPFRGTQEEWWERFQFIEKGSFFPASEVHQRIAQWLDNQKK